MATVKPEASSRLALDVKRVQEAARRAADGPGGLVRRVVDALPVLIAHIDLEQRYTFVNAAYARWFGPAPDALPGRLVHEILDPAAYEAARPYIERALAGEAVTFENTLELAGGARREVLAHLVPDLRDGRVQGASAVISDITAQKRAEADAGRLAAIVEASADAIVSATLDGVFTSWNASAEKLFGYTAEEALGAPITIILPEDLLAARQEVVERLRRGERVEHADSVRVTKAGRRIPVSVGFAGIRNERGELVGIAASARDISARQRIEQQLQARVRQQEAVAALGRTALAGAGLDSTMQEAVRLVAQTLEVEFVKVLELASGGRELVLRAACGWPQVEVGRSVPADASSQAGYTLAAGRATVVLDLAGETRFRGSRWLHEAGGVSGISAIIAGEEGHAYGVLEAHTTRRREFTTDDVHFLEAVANVLAGAIQRTRAEGQQALLLAELSHRLKNTLAVVQSLAVLTGERAGSFPAFLASFRGRLSALAATHALLTETHWRGAGLEQLARATLAPHVGSDRIRLEVGHVKLRPAAAQTISLLFHELATNAGKHGALTVPGGQVTLSARVTGEPGRAVLELVWREDGGPKVEKPATRGFGTSVLFRAIEHQHDGTVEVDWRPEGLICKITIPAPEALADHPHPAPVR